MAKTLRIQKMKYMLRNLAIVCSLVLFCNQSFAQEKIRGQDGAFVGQVLISVSQIFPPGILDKLTAAQRKEANVVGDRTVGAPVPLQGATVKLGTLESYSDTEGYFSFNSMPTGIVEGTIFEENDKIKPIAKFSVDKLFKKGTKVEPIIIKIESDVVSHLAGMNG